MIFVVLFLTCYVLHVIIFFFFDKIYIKIRFCFLVLVHFLPCVHYLSITVSSDSFFFFVVLKVYVYFVQGLMFMVV